MSSMVDRVLNEEDFGFSKSRFASFDAFPKVKQSYQSSTRNGGYWVLVMLVIMCYLLSVETIHWHAGVTMLSYSVEKGISHDLQINIDVVVNMPCADIDINVQDAAGDRILAEMELKRDSTSWAQWGAGGGGIGARELHKLERVRRSEGFGGFSRRADDVHKFLSARKRKRKFGKTPRLRGSPDSCRVYGSLEGNKVRGDFHITARGHGYTNSGVHLNHNSFNFSHQINELSFGPYYPSLKNPLDNTLATTTDHFYKFQYYTSIVPTIYTDSPHLLTTANSNAYLQSRHIIHTNQYAVTSQSHPVPERSVPGIFVKYDIEPISLTMVEYRRGIFAWLMQMINVASGVLVAGGWCHQIFDRVVDIFNDRRTWKGGIGVGPRRIGVLG